MFSSILQDEKFALCLKKLNPNDEIVKHMKEYCSALNDESYVVSLSGGVDSMVITTILKYLGKNVDCIHINYNNRKESIMESDFLHYWCKHNEIKLHFLNIDFARRGEINRSLYEDKTKTLRFNYYTEILSSTTAKRIILGHHDDDIIENVLSNVCRANELTDLTVMNKESNILGVNISRPLIGCRKYSVYHFAKNHQVPFFKDTTPKWSIRGKFRHILLPQLINTYPNVEENLLKISKQSQEWDLLIKQFIVMPFIHSITYNDDKVIADITEHKYTPLCFWKCVFRLIFNKYNLKCPSFKNIALFCDNLRHNKKTILGKHSCSEIVDNKLYLYMSK